MGDHSLTSPRDQRRRERLGPASTGQDIDAVIRHVDGQIDEAIERMIAMRRFRSAASGRAAATDYRACAEWFVEELRSIGFSASVRDTPRRPIAVGHDRGSCGPSVLFCGDYEAGPSGLWRRNPRDEVASSSAIRTTHQCGTDQLIQLMAFVEACRAWKAVAGRLPMAVSVLIAGEGWPASVALTSFLHMYAHELKADLGLAPAAGNWCRTSPAINTMLRGVCCEEFAIVVDGSEPAGPDKGAVVNPMRTLARILGDLHDPSGRVTISGFYAGLGGSLRMQSDRPSGATSGTGNRQCARCSTISKCEDEGADLETMPAEPTCEVDSFGGSLADGGRLATPASAFARLSFHLVCDQVADVVRDAFRDFARARVPSGHRIEFVSGRSAPPISFTASSPMFRKAQQALTAEWDRQTVFACGDAAPAIHALHEVLGMEAIVISFPQPSDGCYSPSEASEVAKNYRFGVRSWARILDALAR